MKKMSRIVSLLLVLCMVLAMLPSVFAAVEPLTTEVLAIEKYGNLDLKVKGSELLALGYQYGDLITVEMNGKSYDMPIGTNYSDVDNGLPVCRVVINESNDYVVLAINMGDLATTAGIATKTKITEDPGYRWDYNEGVTVPVAVKITLKEAGGYYDEWLMHQLTRTNAREDYPTLSDAEFANFRVITTTGMGNNILYRSSSPVNPELGRNGYADAAMRDAAVKTVMNLADNEEGMKAYEGYADTYYSTAKVIPLNLGVDFTAPEFKEGLKKGFEFLIANEGPYLIHCNEGKDRAGFVSAILECLMGASADEVIADYMTTYKNYYGVTLGSEQYNAIASSNIQKSLAVAFGVADITAEGVDLAAEATAFLKDEVGLTDEQIAALKTNLGRDSYNLATSDELIIYYTNDVHTYIDGKLSYDTIADLKTQTAKTAAGVLLVDAGDHIQGTAYGSMDEGKKIIELMNAAGYDLATLGNHEFDYGMERTLGVIDQAEFPYVSCNFYHEKDGVKGDNVLDSYKIFELDGKKIALIGITTPESFTKSTPKYFQDEAGNYIYGIAGGTDGAELYASVQTAIDAARAEGVDYVIALGHCGDDPSSKPWTSEEVIANTTGLDAFIDGHSHSTVEMKEVEDKSGGKVVLTQTGSYFAAIGRMSITADGIKTELLTDYTGSDAEVAAIKNNWIAEIDTKLGEVIGHTDLSFDNYDKDGKRLVRSQETNTGDFAADALYYLFDNMDLDVDLAIMNGGGVRNKAITGDISYKTCKEIHTFGNVACLITVTGQQILDALEWGAKDAGTAECGGFLQVSGVSYEIHTYIPSTVQKDEKGVWTGGPTGEYRVKNVIIGGKPLDPKATYNLAGYNYTLRDLGDGFAMFEGAVNVLDYVMDDYMVLANYVKSFPEKDGKHEIEAANSVLGANYAEVTGEGRITIVSEKAYENKFTDVKEDAWYYEYVMKMAQEGVVIGMTTTTFEPEGYLTRGQMVLMLYRVAGEPEVEGYSTFTDVSKTAYYAKAVAWAEREGVVKGTTETTFAPNARVTREQMVTMFHRLENEQAGTGDLSKFKDPEKVSGYALDAMKWAVGNGIINGMTFSKDGPLYLDPQGFATRAQAAKVFCVWMEICVNK